MDPFATYRNVRLGNRAHQDSWDNISYMFYAILGTGALICILVYLIAYGDKPQDNSVDAWGYFNIAIIANSKILFFK